MSTAHSTAAEPASTAPASIHSHSGAESAAPGEGAGGFPLGHPFARSPIIESEQHNEIDRAVFRAKAKIPPITRNQVNEITRSTFASYDHIQDVVLPVLRKQGIDVRHQVSSQNDQVGVLTRLVHVESGQFIGSLFTLPCDGTPFVAGALITRARRYNLTALLDLRIQEDDDDAQMAERSRASSVLSAAARVRDMRARAAAAEAGQGKPAAAGAGPVRVVAQSPTPGTPAPADQTQAPIAPPLVPTSASFPVIAGDLAAATATGANATEAGATTPQMQTPSGPEAISPPATTSTASAPAPAVAPGLAAAPLPVDPPPAAPADAVAVQSVPPAAVAPSATVGGQTAVAVSPTKLRLVAFGHAKNLTKCIGRKQAEEALVKLLGTSDPGAIPVDSLEAAVASMQVLIESSKQANRPAPAQAPTQPPPPGLVQTTIL